MEFFPDGYALSGMACVAAADFHQQTTSCQERPEIGPTRSIQLYSHQIELVSSLQVLLLERRHILLRRCRQCSARRKVSRGAYVFGAYVRSTSHIIPARSGRRATPIQPPRIPWLETPLGPIFRWESISGLRIPLSGPRDPPRPHLADSRPNHPLKTPSGPIFQGESISEIAIS